MTTLQQKQHIRFATIEKPHARIVVAFLVEIHGTETVIVSEPKIVKIIPKVTAALKGEVSSGNFLALPGSVSVKKILEPVLSPFVSLIFGYSSTSSIVGLAPQPPTKN